MMRAMFETLPVGAVILAPLVWLFVRALNDVEVGR